MAIVNLRKHYYPLYTKDTCKRQTAGYESERPQVVKIPQNGKIFCGILLCEILKIQFCALT